VARAAVRAGALPWASHLGTTAGPTAAALDSTPLETGGGVWHTTHREQGGVPHTSIDTEAGWNTSGGHGWWYGWTRHLAVTVGSVWSPRAAELTVVNRGGNEVAPLWLAPLPAGVRYVLGDTYDNAPTLRQLVWLLHELLSLLG
jgi:hypothetical protein